MNTKNSQLNENVDGEQRSSNGLSRLRTNDELGHFLSRFFKIITIHKWLFLVVLVILTIAMVIYGLRQPTVYRSEYEVFYNETMRQFVDESTTTVVKSDFDKNYWLRAMVSDELLKMTLKNSGFSYKIEEFRKMIDVDVLDKRKEDRIPVFRVQVSSKYREHIPFIIRAYIRSLNDLLLINQSQNSERLISYLTSQIDQNNQKLNQIDVQINGSTSGTGEIIDFDKIKLSLDDFRKDLLNATVNLASIQSSRRENGIGTYEFRWNRNK